MPKKPDPAWTFVKDLETRLRQAADLPAVLQVLGEARGQELPGRLFPLALNMLATRAAAEGGSEQALQAGEWLMESALALHGGKPPEPVVTSMVRLCCASGAPRRALTLVDEAQAAGMKPRLRTLSAILARAAEVEDRETCDHIWTRLVQLSLEPQDKEFAAMLRSSRSAPHRQLDILRQMLEEVPVASDPALLEEVVRAFGVEGIAALREADPSCVEGGEVGGRKWKVGWTSVDADGQCSLSSRRLQALELSEVEEEELFSFAAKLADDSGRNRNFRRFQHWLANQAPYDVIIDGANVGFNNQNREGGHFQYHQIDTVVRQFRDEGRRVLVVLHPKWLKEDPDLSIVKKKKQKLDQISLQEPSPPREEEIEDDEADIVYPHDPVTQAELDAPPETPLHTIRRWKEWQVLARVPVQDCDDWYWLFAALHSVRRGMRHVQVVSNDHMRDHHWRMFGRRAFTRWQERHMTRVSIWSETADSREMHVTLTPPRPYSLQAQVSPDGATWHFPVHAAKRSGGEDASSRRLPSHKADTADYRWLVAWRET